MMAMNNITDMIKRKKVSQIQVKSISIAVLFLFTASYLASLALLHNIQNGEPSSGSDNNNNNQLRVTTEPDRNLVSSDCNRPKMSKNMSAHAYMVTPMWSCSTLKKKASTTTPKLVFVHAFKTAGMSIRELLVRYSVDCHAGIGLVSECSGLSPNVLAANGKLDLSPVPSNSTSSNDIWWNDYGSHKGKPCSMKGVKRSQDPLNNQQIQTEQVATELDIMAGHVPLGVGLAWSNKTYTGKTTEIFTPRVQYLSFFRKAVDKFVSGIMYQKKDQDYSQADIIDLIKQRVKGELGQGKYREGYSAYLLTPTQKEMFYGPGAAHNSEKNRTDAILYNLREKPILIGIVERMSESLQLIQFLIDNDYEQTALFESFGMTPLPNPSGNEISRIAFTARQDGPGKFLEEEKKKNNPSKYETSTIVAALEKDTAFWPSLQEYVKYDDQIYQEALRLHKLQYEIMLHKRAVQGDLHLEL